MKATKLILAAALLTGLASISYAGIGAQYWTQQSINTAAQKATAAANAESTHGAMNCGACACCAGAK